MLISARLMRLTVNFHLVSPAFADCAAGGGDSSPSPEGGRTGCLLSATAVNRMLVSMVLVAVDAVSSH